MNNKTTNLKKVIPTTYLVFLATIILALIFNKELVVSLLLGFAFSFFAYTRKIRAIESGKPQYFKRVAWTNYLLLVFILVISFYKSLNPFVVLFAAYSTNFVFLLTVIGRALKNGRNRNS